MAKVRCNDCNNVMEVFPLGGRKRGREACEGCGSDNLQSVSDTTPLGQPASKAKRQKTGVIGRSNAAPSQTKWPLGTINKDVSYITDLSSDDWKNADGASARLVFDYLDEKTPAPQGLIIKVPRLSQQNALKRHFAAATAAMIAKKTKTSCTEAVGEIAAAMAVLDTFPGYSLEQGFDAGSGPGIDQIWTVRDGGAITKVLIVEAKGPGASENQNLFMPPEFEQMSSNWIIHNLASMKKRQDGDSQKALASEIVAGAGIKVGVCYPGYNGASKNYYGVMEVVIKKPLIEINRLTVEARWQDDGMLSYNMYPKGKIESFKRVGDAAFDRQVTAIP